MRTSPARSNERRSEMTRTKVGLATVVVVTVTGAIVAGSSAHAVAPRTTDPLVGTWDTGPFPASRLRAGLLARGFTRSEVSGFFKNLGLGKVQEFNLVFYRENGIPFQVQTGWDPTMGSKPSDGDHGPYKLLGHHRFTVSGVDPPTDRIHTTYSYTVTGSRLKLRLVKLAEPFPPAQRRLDRMFPIATALLPYKKIG
jgi:hypothetical protein